MAELLLSDPWTFHLCTELSNVHTTNNVMSTYVDNQVLGG